MPSYLETRSDTKNREYFAAKKVDECVSLLSQRIDEYYAEMNRTGRINLYRNSYFKFFQGFILKGAIYHSGSLGELTNTYVNHYGNLITHSVNMVCQQKLSYEPQATVDDSQGLEQIKLAKGILYLYANRTDTDLDGKLRLATEMSEVFLESYVSVLWNKNLGRTIAGDFDEENGETTINEGDNEYEVWSPFDVILDTSLPNNAMKKWLVLRKWENKFDVAAKYPKYADEIRGITMGGHIGDTQLSYSIASDSDIIPVYYFFHMKTPAVPKGRLTIFVDTNIICADGDLPYREIPLYRMAARELWGSPYGYSRAIDTLPLQESVDRLCSSVLTNEITFSTQNILMAKGSSITWEDLYGGLNVIEWDSSLGEAGKPAALQLTSTPQETFKFIEMNIAWMGILQGINDAIKGNADLIIKGQASGEALALMTTNAIQFNSDLQKAYVRLAEQVGTATLHNIQDFAFPIKGMERKGTMEGANGNFRSTTYTKDKIDKIDKVMVRYGNPFSQTTSGRLQMAATLLQSGKITPEQYFEVMETGNIEPVLQAEESQNLLITEENEALMRGEMVQPLKFDNHPLHILEHLAKLSNMDARENPKVIAAIQNHVEAHRNLWKQISMQEPEICALLKIPVLGAPPPSPNAPNSPGGAPQSNGAPVPQMAAA